jgi:NTP pyrophosphatase (non-canonical NTP hydrolase)
MRNQGLITAAFNAKSISVTRMYCALNRNPELRHSKASNMTIQQAQETVDSWIKTHGVRYFSELTNMAILTEEVGEVARIMSRQYGEQSFKASDKDKQLSDELADVLFVLICIANQTGIDLTEALQKNLDKKTNRDSSRHHGNEKLH